MPATNYAIVTGGGSGIGRAICHWLAEHGWAVAVVDCCGKAAEQVACEVNQRGGQATTLVMDVASPEAWQQLASTLQAEWPRLDLLVNCAGNLLTGAIDDCEPEDLRRLVEVNLLGTMYGCQAMLPWLKASASQSANRPQPSGLLNIASIFAVVTPPRFAAYNASKAGIVALTETLRCELASSSINATVVLPGITPTSLFRRAKFGSPEQQQLCERFVEQSVITPQQVAEQAFAGASRGQLYVIVGRRSRLYARLKRLAPQWLVDFIGRRAAKEFGES